MASRKSKAVMAAMRATMPLVDRLDISKQRLAQDYISLLIKPAKGTSCREISIGGIKAAWITPPLSKDLKNHVRQDISKQKAFLHCHGGSFMCGTLKYSRIFASKIAHASGLPVLTYEYRLAPENPFPAAIEDTMRTYGYLIDEGYQSENIILIGESAGGNLCLEIVLECREKGLPVPGALICLSPWVDLAGTGESYYGLQDKDPSLNPQSLLAAARYYAGDNDLLNPRISPLFGDFSGFPPTLIQAGTNEILMSDAERLYVRMREQEVHAELQLFEEMFHVFQLLDLPESKDAIAKIMDFLREGAFL